MKSAFNEEEYTICVCKHDVVKPLNSGHIHLISAGVLQQHPVAMINDAGLWEAGSGIKNMLIAISHLNKPCDGGWTAGIHLMLDPGCRSSVFGFRLKLCVGKASWMTWNMLDPQIVLQQVMCNMFNNNKRSRVWHQNTSTRWNDQNQRTRTVPELRLQTINWWLSGN